MINRALPVLLVTGVRSYVYSSHEQSHQPCIPSTTRLAPRSGPTAATLVRCLKVIGRHTYRFSMQEPVLFFFKPG
jgi:hypothetical protein